MANEMIVCLFVDTTLQLGSANFLAPEKAAALFLRMFAGHDFLECSPQNQPRVRGAAFKAPYNQRFGEKFLSRDRLNFAPPLGVRSIQQALHLPIERRQRTASHLDSLA